MLAIRASLRLPECPMAAFVCLACQVSGLIQRQEEVRMQFYKAYPGQSIIVVRVNIRRCHGIETLIIRGTKSNKVSVVRTFMCTTDSKLQQQSLGRWHHRVTGPRSRRLNSTRDSCSSYPYNNDSFDEDIIVVLL